MTQPAENKKTKAHSLPAPEEFFLQGVEAPGLTAAEARAIQRAMKDRVRVVPMKTKPRLVAGADAAFPDGEVLAVACLFTYPELELVDMQTAVMKLAFPYVPGLLSFREGPAVIRAVRKLKERPDVLMLDGQGIAHPQMIGIASHVGVLLDMPTVGCAKSRLVGEFLEPGRQRGSASALEYKGQVVGTVLRSKDGVRPLFVSPGHLVDIQDSVDLVLSCSKGFRLPEPTRVADLETKKLKKKKS